MAGWKWSGHPQTAMLVLMSNRGPRPNPLDANSAAGVSWPTNVVIPSGVTVWAREHAGRLTISGRGSGASAFRVVDLRTWESVSDFFGDLAERGALARLLEELAQDRLRDASRRRESIQPVARMEPNDLATWSPMQILAATTAARWSLPEALGGTTEEIRRVNGAFLTVVWGL